MAVSPKSHVDSIGAEAALKKSEWSCDKVGSTFNLGSCVLPFSMATAGSRVNGTGTGTWIDDGESDPDVER